MSAIELYARKSQDFDAKLSKTTDLLWQAARDYAPLIAGEPARISQASSLGAEDVVISHLINSLQLDIGIFVLETGKLHGETLALLERLKATSRAPVTVFNPIAEAVSEFDEREGKDAIYKTIKLRKRCCQIRKLEPLSRALEHKAAWITGLRREQAGARADVALVDCTEVRHVKFNPLANWTWGDVWHYIDIHRVDYNPLHDHFFPSIGCAPCTRAISMGEDFRAGRWWWEDDAAKECGLHVASSISPAKASA